MDALRDEIAFLERRINTINNNKTTRSYTRQQMTNLMKELNLRQTRLRSARHSLSTLLDQERQRAVVPIQRKKAYVAKPTEAGYKEFMIISHMIGLSNLYGKRPNEKPITNQEVWENILMYLERTTFTKEEAIYKRRLIATCYEHIVSKRYPAYPDEITSQRLWNSIVRTKSA